MRVSRAKPTPNKPVPNGSAAGQKIKDRPKYRASIRPRSAALPDKLVAAIQAIEKEYGQRVFMFLQADDDQTEFGAVSESVYRRIQRCRLPDKPIILLIHSLGGFADSAYQIVLALRYRCGSFSSLVPVQAKSAATLLAMGGTEIIMPPLAHLGPIDAQVFDYDIVGRKSALEVVQQVERLRAEAMETLKHAAMSLYMGTRLPITTILPAAVELTTGLMRPLLDHVDVNQYMRMSRTMKIGEEYAVRIMEEIYGREKSAQIARHFAQNFPEHGFIICAEEARQHLNIVEIKPDLESALKELDPFLGEITAYGTLEEIKEKPNEVS